MNLSGVLLAAAPEGQAGGGMTLLIVYVVIFAAFAYFFMMRPQKKEQDRVKAMLESLATGDVVLTTSGFYGTVIAIDEDTVVVEFGDDKHCRIPMQKSAIAQVEKAE